MLYFCLVHHGNVQYNITEANISTLSTTETRRIVPIMVVSMVRVRVRATVYELGLGSIV